ncbi:MAG: hypothetical protein EHM45_23345 [Desulfobacteraceae bacterium]|nr:MAG: hypothetical protein EHM45_23345 [Desulfobacteraceae bacterium]
MLKLFKDGDDMAILTDAVDERSFMGELAETLAALIDAGAHDGDWSFQFSFWLPLAADICCKYRGYKNDVIERSVLCASSHGTLPTCRIEAIYENGKAVVEPEGK